MLPRLRCYEVDLLRFIAAMAVVFRHYAYRGYAAAIIPQSFPDLARWSKYGYLGVELFFVISGFVIALSMQGRSAVQFAIARIVRLYPAFWACCSLTAVFIVIAHHPEYEVSLRQYLLNMTLLGGFLGADYVDGVYWTLETEIIFYCWIFALLSLGAEARLEWFLAAWLGLSAFHATIGLRYLLALSTIPAWAPYFVAGAVFYRIRAMGWTMLRAALLLAALMLALHYSGDRIVEMETQYATPLSRPIVFGVVVAIFGVFLLVSLDRLRWLNHRAMLIPGLLTYPLYLLHERIGFIVMWRIDEQVNRYLLLAAVIASMLGASWLVHVAVERPVAPRLRAALESLAGCRRRSPTP